MIPATKDWRVAGIGEQLDYKIDQKTASHSGSKTS